jgi:hypothetical protein
MDAFPGCNPTQPFETATPNPFVCRESGYSRGSDRYKRPKVRTTGLWEPFSPSPPCNTSGSKSVCHPGPPRTSPNGSSPVTFSLFRWLSRACGLRPWDRRCHKRKPATVRPLEARTACRTHVPARGIPKMRGDTHSQRSEGEKCGARLLRYGRRTKRPAFA